MVLGTDLVVEWLISVGAELQTDEGQQGTKLSRGKHNDAAFFLAPSICQQVFVDAP